jgi:hypothetical protein
MMQFLIDYAKADVNFSTNRTVLARVITAHSFFVSDAVKISAIKVLLKNGANPLKLDNDKSNALHYLAQQNNLAITNAFFNAVKTDNLKAGDVKNLKECTPANYIKSKEIKKIFKKNKIRKTSDSCEQ